MGKKKILLVSANKYAKPYPVYPLGLSFILTILQNRMPDHEIKIFDFQLKNLVDFTVCLNTFQPDYIGVSLRNVDDVNIYRKESFIDDYKDIIDTIKKNQDCKIIIGGAGYSIFPEYLFNYLKPDFGIYGEGEESFYQLIQCFDKGTAYEKIEGLVYSKNGEVFLNFRKNFKPDLDLKFENDLIDFYWIGSGMLSVQSKRGCPYKCIYCTYPIIEGKKVRTLNTDKILEALSELYFEKGINYIFFNDSIFNIHNDYNYELAEKIINSQLQIKWGAYFSPHNLDEKLLKTLKKSGLTHIEFGTDSISDDQLENYQKDFTVSDILRTSKLCNDLDIYFAHYLILGGVGETEDTLNETFENSIKINKTVFFPFIGMRIYPGTELESIALKESIISKDENLIKPKYYISNKIDLATLKDSANQTGKKWIFPDEDMKDMMQKMRILDKKGPLWEYLIK